MSVPVGMSIDRTAVSRRRSRIVAAVGQGMFLREIAQDLNMSLRTVQRHLAEHRRGVVPKGSGMRPTIPAGAAWMPPRRRLAWELTCEGFTVAQIAMKMGIAERTVKIHRALARASLNDSS